MIQELDALIFRINDLIAYIERDEEFDVYNRAYVDALKHVCEMINDLSPKFVINDCLFPLKDGSKSF